MASSTRTGLIVGGAIALALGGGLAAVGSGILPNPFRKPQPANWPNVGIPWPTTTAQAHADIVALDVSWWQDWQAAGQPTAESAWTAAMVDLHLAATLIRASYPGSGPSQGYTCQQLVGMGNLPPSFPCPQYAAASAIAESRLVMSMALRAA